MTSRKPRHPGALIKRQYLEPLNMTVTEFAKLLDVPIAIAFDIIEEKSDITPNIAVKLGIAFNTTPNLWLNLQHKFNNQ